MGKILVVKGVDFSDVAVAKVNILESPYYEEAYRLIGDGAAAINTLFVQNSDGLEIDAKIQIKTSDIYIPQNIISNYSNESSPITRIIVQDYMELNYGINSYSSPTKGYISNSISIEKGGVYSVKFNKNSVNVNNQTVSLAGDYTENGYAYAETPLGLFARVGGAVVSDCDFIGHVIFKVDDVKVREFVPCVLKQNISASLASDGNGHNAGECGMWDIVGNKFYGNYNQSGTFTVQ